MDRACHAGAARPRRRRVAHFSNGPGGLLRVALLLALAGGGGLSIACSQLGPDLDQVVAIELVFPDSGRIEVTDTLRPRARALNGRGDSVAAAIVWASLDTGIVGVLDSTTGVTLARAVGTGRLQARAGTLRSNPQNVFVLPPLDTAYAGGPTAVVVAPAPDTLSDSLVIQVGAAAQGTNPLGSRRVVFTVDSTFPPGGATLTFVPRDTVKTGTNGKAAVQLKFAGGTRPDSVVVRATLRHLGGGLVAGTPVRFLVEFQP